MIHIDNWNIVVGFIHIHLYNIMRKEGRKQNHVVAFQFKPTRKVAPKGARREAPTLLGV